jgi:hypothetical protein
MEGNFSRIIYVPFGPLWVEGEVASNSSRDKAVMLTPQGAAACPNPDKANFTVLFVGVSGLFGNTNTVADDNSGQAEYVLQAGTKNLGGPRKFIDRWGYGIQYCGAVSPSDFKPSDFGAYLLLQRDAHNCQYADGGGALGTGQALTREDVFNATLPEGNDWAYRNGYAPYSTRDDDPQSGGSAGKIYDWDCPGVHFAVAPTGAVARIRFSSREFAIVKLADGTKVVCSNLYESHVALSMIKTDGPWDAWTPQAGIANDNEINAGPLTHLTWNLQ